MKALYLLLVVAAVAGWLYVQERDYRDQLAAGRDAWLAENCIPSQPHERGEITVRADGSTQCARFENVGYGRAERLVFAEVRP